MVISPTGLFLLSVHHRLPSVSPYIAKGESMMNKPRIYQMSFSKIDPLYVKKSGEKKDKPKKKSMKSSVG
jgi:hypothetical protein